ncbi:MAG: hypothetical protein ABI972_15065 [Acidobacteriota bacterium]
MLSTVLIVESIIDKALDEPAPLLYRGCLAVGSMKIDGDFLIGPAIDEAAEYFELSDGPFFWLAPSALAINHQYAATFIDRIEPTLMVPYEVPMKDGTAKATLAGCHFGLTRPFDGWRRTKERIYSAFGGAELPGDIEQKRSNIMHFLQHVESIAGTDWCGSNIEYRKPSWEDLTASQRARIIREGGLAALKDFGLQPTPLRPSVEARRQSRRREKV